MNRMRFLSALTILCLLLGAASGPAWAQQRRQQGATPARRAPVPPARTTNAVESRLTGAYQLDHANSEDPQEAAERATLNTPFGASRQEVERMARRLSSPEQLAIERRGRTISIASTRAPRITFEADGRERVERPASGAEVRSRAVLSGEELMVSYTGVNRNNEFSVTFYPIDQGRRLQVTRRIYDARLGRTVVVRSVYEKISNVARWDVYGRPEAEQVAAGPRGGNRRVPPAVGARRGNEVPGRNDFPGANDAQRNNEVPGRRTEPPVARNLPPPPAQPDWRDETLIIRDETRFVAVLNNNLSTATTRPGDPFTMTVREPAMFAGATIEGYVSRVSRGGRISGRSEMDLAFERIRLRDGRVADLDGYLETLRPAGGEQVYTDIEGGTVQDRDNQTSRTVQRTAIGAAVGAVIGAIVDEGRGAALGAAIGAAAGAGSVYAQGREDLELRSGTEIVVRASTRQ